MDKSLIREGRKAAITIIGIKKGISTFKPFFGVYKILENFMLRNLKALGEIYRKSSVTVITRRNCKGV
jgi:hypothetical protein